MLVPYNIGTTLFYLNPDEHTILPCLVKSYNVDEDVLIYTIAVDGKKKLQLLEVT